MPPTMQQNWADTIGKEAAALLSREERMRQEAIYELINTEATHVQMLENLDKEFCQKMISGNLLPPDQVKVIFPNLPELITIHGSFLESLKEVQHKGPIISSIGKLLLLYFDGAAGEHLTVEAVTFCSNYDTAMTIIDARKQKDKRFRQFMKQAECDPSRPLFTLHILYISEMQRITRYPLLLHMILRWTEVGSPESEALDQSLERCRSVVQRVNTLMARIEDNKKLAEIQNHLDITSLAKAKHPTAREFADLDLSKRRVLHQGTLTWKFSKGKDINVHALLLEDILVLLEKKENRFIVKCRKRGGLRHKTIFSPIIKLNNLSVRSMATDRNSIYVMDASEPPQLLQLEASSFSERNKWIDVLEKAAKAKKMPASA